LVAEAQQSKSSPVKKALEEHTHKEILKLWAQAKAAQKAKEKAKKQAKRALENDIREGISPRLWLS